MSIGVAQILTAKGFAVAAFDLSDAALARAEAAGAVRHASAADVFDAAGVIVLSLSGAQHVEAVIAEARDAGLLATGAAFRIVINVSTSEAEVSRKLAATLNAAGQEGRRAPLQARWR